MAASMLQVDAQEISKKLELEEVTITGQISESTLSKSIYKVKVIDSKKIMLKGAVNLRDLLLTEMNVKISQDNILGSKLRMQGISGQNVKILIDGIPLIGRMDGNIDLGQINLANIERVEIIEGPMSVIYGTDAIGGVINLITKKSVKSQVEFGQETYFESVGQLNLTTSLGLSSGKQTFHLYTGRNSFGGYTSEDYYNKNIAPSISDVKYADYYERKKQWLPKLQYFVDVNYKYSFEKSTISLQSSSFDENMLNAGLPNISSDGAYAFDETYKTRRFNNYLFYDLNTSKNIQIKTVNAFSTFYRQKNVIRKDLVSMTETPVPDPTANAEVSFLSYNSRATYSSVKKGSLNYQFGYDLTHESSSGDRLTANSSILDAAVFATSESRIKHLSIKPGLRTSYNSRYATPVVPSINLKYDLNSSVVLRASYGYGFRAPSLKELDLYFFDFNHSIIGNNKLKAEKSDNINISANWKKVDDKRVLGVEFAFFYNDIYNMINLALVDASASPPIYTYLNIDVFKTRGFKTEFNLKLNKFSLATGYTITGLYNVAYEANKSIDQFSYSPEVMFNANYSLWNRGFYASLFYKYTGKSISFATDATNNPVQMVSSSYHNADLSVTKEFFKKKIGLSLGVKNIFDIQNINTTYTGGATQGSTGSFPVMWGRTLFSTLKFNLTKQKI